ncbi:unnamed protein product (macronuclear) [Paramecium tetraurelia]|uniref:Uncharacterized protein n=1 Tax=Paramecium tetraurelia TaxID=5888 RepID=A0D180_PARTE|nr:uncharacterized protein GSPATT00012321001 [Paramecium tetraurelia]CAK76797.1 unnamed protein product [Paramecium tetraurelia]|eukprot:XP_001444194.1 hypothetical protein (macronuclear) [Paramecium tetraurelia strain d4-2]
MLRKVNSNAITVHPFANCISVTPNTNERPKTDRIKPKYLISDKTADTLTSSITTLFHPPMPEAKNFVVSRSAIDKYFYKFISPHRRFSEKKNGNKNTSPQNDNCTPFKVSSDIESFRNSVQNIDNDQFSMSHSGTSNKDHQNYLKKLFCNSHQKPKSLNIRQEKIKSNKHFNIPDEDLVDLNQEQDQIESLENQGNFIQNHIQEDPEQITFQFYNPIETPKMQDQQDQGNFEIQKFDSLQIIECSVKQFRVKIKKTILINQTQNQKPEIKQNQISEILSEIQTEMIQPNNYFQQQQELEDTMFNQAKSEILNPLKKEQNVSTLNTKKGGSSKCYLYFIF